MLSTSVKSILRPTLYCRWWSRAVADQDDGDPDGEQGADPAAPDARLERGHQEAGEGQDGRRWEEVLLRQRSGHKAVRNMRHAVQVGEELQAAHGPMPRGQRTQTRVLSLPAGVQEERQPQRPLQICALRRETQQVRQLWKGVPHEKRAVPPRRELRRQAIALGASTIDCPGSGAADHDRDGDGDGGHGAAVTAAAADSGAACELTTPAAAAALDVGGGPSGVGGAAAAADLASTPGGCDATAAAAAPAAQG